MHRTPRPLTFRLVLGLGLIVGLGLVLLVLLLLTQSALTVWSLLRELPVWAWVVYGLVLTGISALIAGLAWSLLGGRSRPQASRPAPVTTDPTQLREEIEQARAAGVVTTESERELAELERRNLEPETYVALFGAVSTGKSSLIRAMLPTAKVAVDPRAGTTREIHHYAWKGPEGQRLALTDLPGLFEPGGELTPAAREETRRADLLVYVCSGDLTRDELREAEALASLGKPLIVALNKIDRYRESERAQIRERLQERLADSSKPTLVSIQTGGTEEVIRVHADGREERIERQRQPQVTPLLEAILAHGKRLQADLLTARGRGFAGLGADKLERARNQHRHRQGEGLVRDYTRRAIVGALAAVTPGSDLLIQGYLGIGLVRDLCQLYGVSARELDARRFVNLAARHVGKKLPLLLAIAGNVLKAFPGLGTVTGAVAHAVAYGLIFESLGASVIATLEQDGELRMDRAVGLFEEKLSEDLENRTRTHAKAVFGELRRRRGRRLGERTVE